MTAIPDAEYGVDVSVGATPLGKPLPADPARLSSGIMAIFSGPAMPLAALALPLVVYLPHFYAAQMGISLAAVGAIFSLVRLLDIGVDPLLGSIMDRTRTRFGRFRPWLAASVPILMLASVLVFMPPKGVGATYLTAALVLLYVGYSMAGLGHLAWASVLARDYHGRSRIYGWVQAATMIGTILVLVLPVILSRLAKNGDAAGVASMGWFVIVLTPLAVALALWRVKEPVEIGRAGEIKAGLRQYLRMMSRPTVLRLAVCTVLLATAPGVTGAVFLFFFRQARGFSPAEANLLLLIYFVGGFAGAPVWSRIAKTLGKHRTLMISCVYYVAMQGMILVLPKGSMAVAVPAMLLAGLGFSAYLILLRAMTADVCDEARLELNADCTGMLYALHSAGMKIGSALGVVITFPMLQAFGFKAVDGAHNSVAAIHGLELTFVILPVSCVVVGGLSLIGYRLNEARHGEIRAALAVRDAG